LKIDTIPLKLFHQVKQQELYSSLNSTQKYQEFEGYNICHLIFRNIDIGIWARTFDCERNKFYAYKEFRESRTYVFIIPTARTT